MGWDVDLMEKMNEDEALRYLTENGFLEGPAQGIALQVLAQGRQSLTGRQVHVFEVFVLATYLQRQCTRCGNCIPSSEIIESWENGGLCGWCAHREENDD